MASFIILNADQADQVRGLSATDPMSALNPIERQGGVFILGAAVLDDPAHAVHHALLFALPQMDSADPAFPPAIEE
jgi:hypothetical protein